MINFKNAAAALVLGLAVVAAATPAMAKHHAEHRGYAARAQVLDDGVGEGFVSPGRADALRDCNDRAGPLKQYTWGEYQGYQLRACMSEHGQIE